MSPLRQPVYHQKVLFLGAKLSWSRGSGAMPRPPTLASCIVQVLYRGKKRDDIHGRVKEGKHAVSRRKEKTSFLPEYREHGGTGPEGCAAAKTKASD